ncbi:MAG: MarR family transcriptional regulator [Hyphomicrobiaceae bacterium]
MTDINTAQGRAQRSAPAATTASDASLERLTSVVELIFFAYRDFTGESDAVLKAYDFGRAHHRVLHFVTWRPGLRVADLLDILKITKQSLARVLKQLVDRGFIVQEAGEADRRERRLHPTAEGRRLAEQLRTLQTRRIAAALAEIEPQSQPAALRFLLALTAREDRVGLEKALTAAGLDLSAERKR